MAKLIFGCGYLGERAARLWRGDGHEVVVVTRSSERAGRFVEQGYRAIVADLTRPVTMAKLPAAETVLFAVGFDRTTAQSVLDVYAGGVRNVLAALPAATGRFIYISTTGVYGDAGGDWVDEETPTDPQRDGGRASLAAEQALAAHPLGARSIILRLAGLYGPSRVPFIKEIREEKPIAAPRHGLINLIHVDDAAEVGLAADRVVPFDNGPRVYCVSDGHPVEREAFYREAARRLKAPPPRFVEPDVDCPRAERAAADRRVRNERMLAELQVKLAYPNYRAGLEALLETENQ